MKLGGHSYYCKLKSYDFVPPSELSTEEENEEDDENFIWTLKVMHPLSGRTFTGRFDERICEEITGKRGNRYFHSIVMRTFECEVRKKNGNASESPPFLGFEYIFHNYDARANKTYEAIESELKERKNTHEGNLRLILKIIISAKPDASSLHYYLELSDEETEKHVNHRRRNEEVKSLLTKMRAKLESYYEYVVRSKKKLTTKLF